MFTGLRRHSRFLLAFALGGAIAAFAYTFEIAWQIQALLGVNGFFLCYLGLTARLAMATKHTDLMRHAAEDDEGIVVILVLAISAVCVSLMAIVWVLNAAETVAWQATLALSAVPLGWGTIHTLVSFRYAHLYYSAKSGSGLAFPGTKEPGIWDFLYFSFGIGMTAQVSDVAVSDQYIRKTVLVHSIGAFFYNAVILALAVNAGLALGS